MDSITVGVTFPLVDPATGRNFIGWGRTLDEAISDALAQLNAAVRARMSVAAVVRQYVEDLL